MNVRWFAVIMGMAVNIVIGGILTLFINPDIFISPDLSQAGDIILFSLPIVLTVVSGYVAGRAAGESRVINGLLVQVVGILIRQLGPQPSHAEVVALAIACGFAALGGYLSRFPASAKTPSIDSQ